MTEIDPDKMVRESFDKLKAKVGDRLPTSSGGGGWSMPRWLKRTLVIGSSLLAVAGIVVTAYWFFQSWMVKNYFNDWAKEMLAAGYNFQRGDIEITGFPSRVNVVVEKPSLAGAHVDATWGWLADEIKIFYNPWQFKHARLTIDNMQFHSTILGQKVHSTDIKIAQMRTSITMDLSEKRWQAKSILDNMQARGVGYLQPFQVPQAQILLTSPSQWAGNGGWRDVEIALKGATVSENGAASGGQPVELFTKFTMFGAMYDWNIWKALTRWRDRRGFFGFRQLYLRWANVSADVDPNTIVYFDQNMQLQTKANVTVTNPAYLTTFARYLEQRGDMSEEDQRTVIRHFYELPGGKTELPMALHSGKIHISNYVVAPLPGFTN